MFFWSGFPFVRITIAFAAGIAMFVFVEGFDSVVFIGLIFSVVFLVTSAFFKNNIFLKYNWTYGLILIVLSFCLGYARLGQVQQNRHNVRDFGESNVRAYQAKVITQPAKKGKYYKSTVEISAVFDSTWQPLSYRINLYVKAIRSPFKYGDFILIKGAPREIRQPQNPDEFNYKRYLTFLTIYQQHFADSNTIKVISSGNGNPIITASLVLRNKFSGLLDTHIKDPQELGIAKALLLGNKSELDDGIKRTYAASGAMHVLAVSGLHVGIIYGVILFVFSLLPKGYQKKWLIAMLAIPLLWSYAFITGLSPSVLRAVTLFTIIAIGNSMNRRSSMINMLAVSALILLVYKPYLLMQVGFQLSYLAVLGIIFIYPQIRKLWLPTDRFRIFFWDIVSISIAAQLATFPLSILYFHRFPPYFLVSNLVVIPAATLIVCVGVAFFTVSLFSNTLTAFLGAILALVIRIINIVLAYIYHLPGSDIDNIYLNVPQTWGLYLSMAFLFLFIVYKNKIWASMASIGIIILASLIGYRWINNNQLKQLTVYNIPYHLSIDLMQSGKTITLMDSILMNKNDKIHFHINPNRLLKGVNSYESTNYAWKQLSYGKAMVWNNVSILVMEEKFKNDDLPFDIVLSNLNPNKVKINTEWYDLENKGALVIDY